MADKVARYVLEFGGDASDLTRIFGSVKSEFASAVADLKRQSDRLDLFSTITDNVPKVQAALDKARASVKSFSDQIDQIKAKGDTPTKALTDSLAQAEKAAASATKELAKQQQQLATLDSQLQKAGVDTNNLAAAQLKLAEASRAASTAAEVAAAKQQLGLVTLKDTEAQAVKLRSAFDTLKNSGVLSASETTIAQQRLNAELKALGETVTKTGGGVKQMGADIKAGFTAVGGPALAAVGGIAAVTAAMNDAIAAAKAYRQALAESGSGLDLTKEKTAALGLEAQHLAEELGLNVNDTLRNLFSLLKAGVPEDNVVDALRISAEAAKASLSDVGTGTKIAKLLLNDFKVAPVDLAKSFDVLRSSLAGGKEGFEALANSGGPLLAVAKASNVSLTDLSAVLRVMTKNGLDADTAMGDLAKIILQLGKSETRQALHAIGIDSADLVTILRELGAQGRSLESVLDLTGVSKKSAAGIATIINSSDQLDGAFKRVSESAGLTAKQLAKTYDSPREISERFHATLDVTKIKLGELAAAGGGATIALTLLLRAFNDLSESKLAAALNTNQAALLFRIASALLVAKQNYDALTAAAERAKKPIEEFHQALTDSSRPLADISLATKDAADKLKLYGDALGNLVPIVQKSLQDQVAQIRDRADTEIALLDRSLDKQVDTAAKTLAINQKANADILDVTQRGQKLITDTIDAQTKARSELELRNIAIGKGNADQYAKDIAAIQLNGLTTELDNARKFERSLIDQRAGTIQRLNALEQSRVSFNEGINSAIRQAALAAETPLEAYYDQQKEIDRLIAKGRETAATQGIQAAEKYFNEAKTLSESLRGEVKSDDTVVVSAFESQINAVKNLKKIRDEYNKASDDARGKEQQALSDIDAKIKTVEGSVESISTKLAILRRDAQEAIQLSIKSDIRGIDEAARQIDELVRDRVIRLSVAGPAGDSSPPASPAPGFNRGGPVAMYAGGGPVFRRLTSHMVPGSGNGDTHPALLRNGSFVMRKAAVQHYGDRVMSVMARGYAQGGWTGFGTGSGFEQFGPAPISQTAADLKQYFRDSGTKLSADEINKLGQYLSSLPPSEQSRLQSDISQGGTSALIAQDEIADGAATQARGAAKAIAPDDVSPVPGAGEAILYAKYVDSYLRFGNVFDLVKKQLGTFINQLQRDPSNVASIQAMIKTARASASNAYLQDFHVGTGFGAQIPGRGAQLQDWYDFDAHFQASKPKHFAFGGPVGTDTQPAWLTPGEVVLKPEVAAMFGGGYLNAMNNLQAPRPQYYAGGGIVPGASVPERGTAQIGGISIAGGLHIHSPFPVDDERTIRKVIQGIDRQLARSGKTIVRK